MTPRSLFATDAQMQKAKPLKLGLFNGGLSPFQLNVYDSNGKLVQQHTHAPTHEKQAGEENTTA
jgi:hypothetical protein